MKKFVQENNNIPEINNNKEIPDKIITKKSIYFCNRNKNINKEKIYIIILFIILCLLFLYLISLIIDLISDYSKSKSFTNLKMSDTDNNITYNNIINTNETIKLK